MEREILNSENSIILSNPGREKAGNKFYNSNTSAHKCHIMIHEGFHK